MKVAFIVPYFGTFPQYFQLFLKSCELNPNYDWLLFTDDERLFNYPSNVHVNLISFNSLLRIFIIIF